MALQRRAERDGIALEIGARGLTDEHLNRYIDLCCRFRARLLRFVIDAPGYEPTTDEVMTVLRKAIPLLHWHGIVLGLENHDRLKASEFAGIVEQVDSPNVGICLNSVNSMGSGEGLAEVVRTLAPHTVNLHIKDFGIERLPHLVGFQIDGRPTG